MTPEERAARVFAELTTTGQHLVTTEDCDLDRAAIARAIREAERFAADDEREACAKLVEGWSFYTVTADTDDETLKVMETIVNMKWTDPLARAIRER